LNKELESAPDEQKTGIQRELDRHTTGVQTSQQELKAFQDHLKRWTNDELESSRTPMDQYLADKKAREAASAAQAAADAIPSQQVPLGIKMPATVEKTRQRIDDTLQDIKDQKDAIDRLNKELESAPDEQKAGIQRQLDRHTTGVQTSQQELKAFQDHLKRLNSKSPGEDSADSGKLPFE
jgi:exonuclease VII large subunit